MLDAIIEAVGREPYFRDESVCIYHADCRDILPLIPVGSVDLVLTDPSYNAKDIGPNQRPALAGAGVDEEAYSSFCQEWFGAVRRLTDRMVFTCGIAHLWEYPPARWVVAWSKPSSVSYSRFGGFNVWEPILFYGKLPKGKRIPRDLWQYDALNFITEDWAKHPCPKPPALWKKLVDSVSVETDIILDPFLGSGTTLRAAKDLGRYAIGIEIEERYCEIAAKRMAQSVMAL